MEVQRRVTMKKRRNRRRALGELGKHRASEESLVGVGEEGSLEVEEVELEASGSSDTDGSCEYVA